MQPPLPVFERSAVATPEFLALLRERVHSIVELAIPDDVLAAMIFQMTEHSWIGAHSALIKLGGLRLMDAARVCKQCQPFVAAWAIADAASA